MVSAAEQLEKPLPKPQRDLLGYASARILEALLEGLIALEFLDKGYTRNAAGKAFQAWRALTGALLALEIDMLGKELGSKDREWLIGKGIPRIPSSRLKSLALLVEKAGYTGYHGYTSIALDLHDYQYHGPDPDLALSRYRSREEAAKDTLYLLEKLVNIIEKRAKPKLDQSKKWTKDHEEALQRLREKLTISH